MNSDDLTNRTEEELLELLQEAEKTARSNDARQEEASAVVARIRFALMKRRKRLGYSP